MVRGGINFLTFTAGPKQIQMPAGAGQVARWELVGKKQEGGWVQPMGTKCPTCLVQGHVSGTAGGGRRTEPGVPGSRPAGAHKGPARVSWACAPCPGDATSRSPVLPPASCLPPAAHLAQASGVPWATSWRLRNCHGRTEASAGDSTRYRLAGPLARNQLTPTANARRLTPHVAPGGAGQGQSRAPLGNVVHARSKDSGKCSSSSLSARRALAEPITCPDPILGSWSSSLGCWLLGSRFFQEETEVPTGQ